MKDLGSLLNKTELVPFYNMDIFDKTIYYPL